ncbi:MAG: alpha/beta hydrolase [Chloroflexaceae bacterium]|nr:alpha/beta hydrolase [Chloroflexaceae bacterium]
MPTLLIWGDQDTDTPLTQAQVLESLIPDSGLVVLHGAGHFAYLEQLPRFVRILAEFIKD